MTLQVGFAKRDITPELGIRLSGYGQPVRPAEKVHDPLAATAMVLAQDGVEAAHVTVDLCVVQGDDVRRIREAVSQATGIAPRHVNLGVSHTHSGPQTFTIPGWGEKIGSYLDELVEHVVAVVKAAKEAVQPVKMGIATCSSKVGVNRRLTVEGPLPRMVADEHGPYDGTMTVIRFTGEAGLVGIVVHCAAHPTAMGCNLLISRDWPGVMIDRMESQLKAPVLFINGSFGDVGPRTNYYHSPDIRAFAAGGGDGVHSVNEVGYLAAGDALRCFSGIAYDLEQPRLKVRTDTIRIGLQPLPALEVAKKELAAAEPKKDQWGGSMAEYQYWLRVVEAHQRPQLSHMELQQTLIAVGPVVIVPMPGEPFTSISLRLRRLSPFPFTLISGLTNDAYTYLPDKEGRVRGGYEAWSNRMIQTQIFAEDSDDTLVNENLRILRDLQAAEGASPRL